MTLGYTLVVAAVIGFFAGWCATEAIRYRRARRTLIAIAWANYAVKARRFESTASIRKRCQDAIDAITRPAQPQWLTKITEDIK